ncbi:MAG: hypothetical protein Q4F13_00645 [Pseudomonadota bacterium]|nr:hypothetical protein [Pseudomonadota bacterium]
MTAPAPRTAAPWTAHRAAPIATTLAALLLSACVSTPTRHTPPPHPTASTPQIQGAGTVWECRPRQASCQSRPYRP